MKRTGVIVEPNPALGKKTKNNEQQVYEAELHPLVHGRKKGNLETGGETWKPKVKQGS